MRRSGVAVLPLHSGRAPRWLYDRMRRLSGILMKILVEDRGRAELLRRVSDPVWFQALGCALGYDWHSSGVTTVLTAAIRDALADGELGVLVVGGKGRASREVPREVIEAAGRLGLGGERASEMLRASRMAAKVDSAVLQDGYSLYHHAVFVTEDGLWAVVQQGMNPRAQTARRYHWLGEGLESFVEEPHSGIMGDRSERSVLDMTSKASREARGASVDLVREGPRKLASALREALRGPLSPYLGEGGDGGRGAGGASYLVMPRRVNWEALRRAYEMGVDGYEELVAVRGVGPATVRALALLAELVEGVEVSRRDPLRYSFAFGGKDGVPYPVDVGRMDRAISLLEELVEGADLQPGERREILRRLSSALPR